MLLTDFKTLAFAFFAFLQLTVVVSGHPQFNDQRKRSVDESTLLTNAARMQAGLPPMKPRSPYSPTRLAPRAGPSSIPPAVHYLEVRKANNGNSVGFISKAFPFDIATTVSERIIVSIPTGSSHSNVAITGQGYPYLGFSDSGDTLGSSDAFPLTTTNAVSANAVAQYVGNAYSGTKSESAIWTYNSGTGGLTPSWAQSPQSVNVKLWYFPVTGTVNIIQTSRNPSSGYQINLYVV